MKLKLDVTTKTKYHFSIVNTMTGENTDFITHNIITNNFFVSAGTWDTVSLAIGSGSGEPSLTDITLFKTLWTIRKDSYNITFDEVTSMFKVSFVFTIPANNSYMGTITECGLIYYSELITHAMLKDAEGNNISIVKTDLDKIIINIDLEFTFPPSETMARSPLAQSKIYHAFTSGSFRNILAPHLQLSFSPDAAIHNGLTVCASNSIDATCVALTGAVEAEDTANHILSVTKGRLDLSWPVAGQHYINGLVFNSFFVIPFPNTDVFPLYPITNIDVGIGDGNTTDFKCPLNLFVENSEVIYKNGIALTRNVDYTIEAYNNADMLPELMASNFGKIIGGSIDTKWVGNQQVLYAPIFRAILSNGTAATSNSSFSGKHFEGNTQNHPTSFSTNNPLLFNLFKPMKVNTFCIGDPYAYGTNIYYVLSYSEDGEIYTEACRLNKPSSSQVIATFDTITAQYWKVTVIDITNETKNVGSGGWQGGYSILTNYSAVAKTNLCLFGYVGEGIKFATPPEEGDVITMDASIDRPMKTDSLILECGVELTY